jgi:hypothetical protein
MPVLEFQRVHVTRAKVRTVWWSCAAGAFVSLAAVAALVIVRPFAVGTRFSSSVVGLAFASGFVLAAARWIALLPPARHPIFDVTGDRFETEAARLFRRFLLAGLAAFGAAAVGAIATAFGADPAVGISSVAAATGLLVWLRRRIAPLVHYLA